MTKTETPLCSMAALGKLKAASAMGFVESPGIHPFKLSSVIPDDALFANGNDLLLRYSSSRPSVFVSAHVLMED